MLQQTTAYIHAASSEHAQIMEAIRTLIHQTVPGVQEEFKWGRPVFRTKKDFAYLKAERTYVTLGFFDFEKLEDKNNLLQGTGKSMRHMKLKTMADVDVQLLTSWLKVASE